MIPVVDCKERIGLLREYSDALHDASLASAARASLAGKSALSEYSVPLRELERTETKASKARVAYQRHIIKHGCAAEEHLA
jgi:hypothetical protein